MDRSRTLDRDEVEKFLCSLSEYKPAIPDELVRYYLAKSGFVTEDVRLERLVALAAQKFLADVANDAISHCRLRQASLGAQKKGSAKEVRVTLTVDDLERALREYGVVLRKPPYFADSVNTGTQEAGTHQKTGGGSASQSASPMARHNKLG